MTHTLITIIYMELGPCETNHYIVIKIIFMILASILLLTKITFSGKWLLPL